ncbi:Protein of unknown function [Asanoa hainanensis]|uniref:DinB superfamily protein n=1 Tax=Asanoa hainanensis TaxID=560556 RepID=A0A239LD06_9ACTN|nr:DinB family protein [Asanoa hainanensis]SNT28351.1 Protein of unknown function [Asanoa hainanensis]
MSEHLTGPPAAGNEVDTLLGALERQRGYIAWKCGGLDAAGLRATLGPSTVTLGGLLKHLAAVEEHTFSMKLFGRPVGEPFASGWELDEDWEWHSAAADSPTELMALWESAVARSRVLVAQALAEGGLDFPGAATWPDGRRASLRRHLIDMVEEYARHVGQADLIRESIDGLVGEDPADEA